MWSGGGRHGGHEPLDFASTFAFLLAEAAVHPRSHTYPSSLRAPEVGMTHPARGLKYRPEVEPLTADLRRLGMTVSKRLLQKLDDARSGLSHAILRATTDQVLEAVLDPLLEEQARARGPGTRRWPLLVAAPHATARRPRPAW